MKLNVIGKEPKRLRRKKSKMKVNSRKGKVLIASALIFSTIGVGSVYEVAQGSSTKALVSQVKVALTSIAPTVSVKVIPVAPVAPANPQATLKVVAPTKVAVVPVKTAVVPVAKTVSSLVKTVAKVATKVFTKGTVKTIVSTKPIKVTVPKGSTVTTKTQSGTQTLTVNTDKVKVTITPTVAETPVDSSTPVLTPQIPDWNGFVAPKVTFDKITACRALGLSTIVNGANPVTGQNDYNSSMYIWNLTPQFKLSNGKYLLGDVNGNYSLHNVNEIVYKNDSLAFEADSLTSTTHPSGSTVIELKLYFKPFNWTPNSYGDPTVIWATGYQTDKIISYDISIPYTAKDC